jgi:RNA polymerase primary sigma factor
MYYGPGTNDLTFTPLTRDAEKALFERYYAGDLAARDELIQKHLRLVAKLSIAYAKRAIPDDEAISAGNYGLIQALNSKRFKPGIGVLFSTYLRSWVQGEIRRALREKGSHHPNMGGELHFFADGAAATGQIGRRRHDDCSHSNSHINAHLMHRIEEETAPSVADLYEEQQINEERRAALDEAFKSLSKIERAVMVGLVCEEKNYTQLGEENGVSRQAVTKAYNRAVRKLRELLGPKYAILK